MRENKFQKYMKEKTKEEPKTPTSVNLYERQIKFFNERGLNLSKVLRDLLDKFIKAD